MVVGVRSGQAGAPAPGGARQRPAAPRAAGRAQRGGARSLSPPGCGQAGVRRRDVRRRPRGPLHPPSLCTACLHVPCALRSLRTARARARAPAPAFMCAASCGGPRFDRRHVVVRPAFPRPSLTAHEGFRAAAPVCRGAPPPSVPLSLQSHARTHCPMARSPLSSAACVGWGAGRARNGFVSSRTQLAGLCPRKQSNILRCCCVWARTHGCARAATGLVSLDGAPTVRRACGLGMCAE